MAPSSNEKEKKSRWRSMLGGGRDGKEEDTSHLRPGPSPKDSAYGSERTTSEQPSARPQSAEPSETNVKQDPSTGNIVTTTVTTTTTTTTVTSNTGEVIKTESTPTTEADASATIRNSGEPTSTPAPTNPRPISEHSDQSNSRQPNQYSAGLKSSNQAANVTNPAELDAPVPGGASAEDGPPIPSKSNRRISREMGLQHPRPISEVTEPPVSPIGSPSGHNFSYPARTPPHQGQQSYQGPQSYQEQQPYHSQQAYQGPKSYQEQPYHSQQAYQGPKSYQEQPYHSQQAYQGHQSYQDEQPRPGQQAYHEQQPHQGPVPYQNQPSTIPGQHTVPDGVNRQGQRPGTFQNLKVAAAGIHGAGETLRGTLNSSIDKHVGHAPPERMAAHQQVISAGATEIETGRFSHSDQERERLKGKGRFGGILRKPVGE